MQAGSALLRCGTLAVNSVTSGEGAGPNTVELHSVTGVLIARFGGPDTGPRGPGTYLCARLISAAPIMGFDALVRSGEPGYVAQPTVATDSCGSVTGYAADGAHMLVTLTAAAVATQYSLQYQFVGGSAPTDIGTRFAANTPQLLLITGRQVPPDSGTPSAISLRDYNVARVTACAPTSAAGEYPRLTQPVRPAATPSCP